MKTETEIRNERGKIMTKLRRAQRGNEKDLIVRYDTVISTLDWVLGDEKCF